MFPYIDEPWATSGDKSTPPDTVQSNGSMSWPQGYGPFYSLDPLTSPNALLIERTLMNGLFNQITTILQQYQQHGTPDFIPASLNGGVAYSYSIDDRVRYFDGTSTRTYQSIKDANTDLPSVTSSWQQDESGTTAAPPPSSSKNLRGVWLSNTTAQWQADQIILQTTTGSPLNLAALNMTINLAATVGTVTGLDTGSLTANTWYYAWAIYNPTTMAQNCIFSLSSTAPVLPSGYTYQTYVGAFRTDGSSHIIGFTQKKDVTRYLVNSNLTGLRLMIGGAQGSTTTPTWVAQSVTNFVPATAGEISLLLLEENIASGAMAAPSNFYGAYSSTSNPPPLSTSAASNNANSNDNFSLESSNVYYASAGASAGLYCKGWTDNLL